MVLIQVVGEEDGNHVPESSSTELLNVLRQLSARLALPQELLPSFMNENKPEEALATYRQLAEDQLGRILENVKVDSNAWEGIEFEEMVDIVLDLTRLYGEDDWTSPRIIQLIDSILNNLDHSRLSLHILHNQLRQLFSPVSHPLLDPSTSRALARPRGGDDATMNMHDDSVQLFKQPSAWGCYNVLRWCVTHLNNKTTHHQQQKASWSNEQQHKDQNKNVNGDGTSSMVEDNIGVILPPTLVMMDDWEPSWRGRGAYVLHHWLPLISPLILTRMRIDQLLLKSLLHTLNLHTPLPIPHVLPTALTLISLLPISTSSTTASNNNNNNNNNNNKFFSSRAEAYATIMDGIISTWIYSISDTNDTETGGRGALISAAKNLESIVPVIGVGIIRWLKPIIPGLLEPLQYPPTKLVLQHFKANLRALVVVIKEVNGMGRIKRWRGQIFDVLARLWIQCEERKMFDEIEEEESSKGEIGQGQGKKKETEGLDQVMKLIIEIFQLIEMECPSVRENEYQFLLNLNDQIFKPLIDPKPTPITTS